MVIFYSFLPLLFFFFKFKISILESSILWAQSTTLMLFTGLTFQVYPHFPFTLLYPVKFLEEGTGGHIFKSGGPSGSLFLLPAEVHVSKYIPQWALCGRYSLIISRSYLTDEADSVKPRLRGLNLLTSLLGDVVPFLRSVTEAYFGSTFLDTSSSLTLLSSLEVSQRLYCTGSIPWHRVSLTHLPFHYRAWKQLQLSEVCSYFETLW